MTQALKVRGEAQELRSLDEAFKWALRQAPRFEPEDVVVQDEYTHDVLFRAPDKSYLVFDTS
jgi:hypothetical protein